MSTLTAIDIPMLKTKWISAQLKTSWNLPKEIAENCDVFCLRKWTGAEIAARMKQAGEDSNALELFDFKFSLVWTPAAKKALSWPNFSDRNFWLSFRSCVTDNGRESYVLIQLDDKQKLS